MKDKKHVITRRDFIRGTVAATIGTSVLGFKWPKAEARAVRSSLVTIIRDKKAMDSSKNVDTAILNQMLEQTLIKFTGEKNIEDAWLSLVKPDDVIGLVEKQRISFAHTGTRYGQIIQIRLFFYLIFIVDAFNR